MTAAFKLAIVVSVLGCVPIAYAEEDAEGCKDHPVFTRMPGYRINRCETKRFDARDFPADATLDADNKPAKSETIEGVQTYLAYDKPDDSEHASGLEIQRNYEQAIKAAGGTLIAKFGAEDSGKQLNDDTWGGGDHASVLKLEKAGKEIWVEVLPYNGGGGYVLYIAERQAMQQVVAVNELIDKIQKTGLISLYINFETGKATINPDSYKQLDEVVTALKQSSDLKLEVGGHTDNVGSPSANQTLSEARAQSVMKYLTGKGIDASRLTAKGYGQTVPIADNRTEDGRAKNRRVDLVKK